MQRRAGRQRDTHACACTQGDVVEGAWLLGVARLCMRKTVVKRRPDWRRSFKCVIVTIVVIVSNSAR